MITTFKRRKYDVTMYMTAWSTHWTVTNKDGKVIMRLFPKHNGNIDMVDSIVSKYIDTHWVNDMMTLDFDGEPCFGDDTWWTLDWADWYCWSERERTGRDCAGNYIFN